MKIIETQKPPYRGGSQTQPKTENGQIDHVSH